MPSIRLSFLLLALVLSSCAYVVEKTFQDVTILTPGAHGALCLVDVEGLKYEFRPPETIPVTKSKEDMIVDCRAPGNRRKVVTIESDISTLSIIGAPGAPWDYASGAMFKYPETIEVDFRNIPATAMPLPAQNNPDIKQPEEYYLEEFRPGQPVMNSDRHVPAVQLHRRMEAEEDVYYPPYGRESDSGEKPQGKGDLMKVIGDLEGKSDPATAAPATPSGGDAYGPSQNYPVE
ncbi:MAG: hypothetical protein DHS20C02_03880 [Micavibrio sp.]|nr:MAG: hypothetical protein DHS20C02_03880 [Micavibrio sp.]